MLFNTWIFIAVFFPLVYIIYNILLGYGRDHANAFLVIASILFYSYWNVSYTLIFIPSILINYWVGSRILDFNTEKHLKYKKYMLFAGIGFNLSLIAYFKYVNFIILNLNILIGVDYTKTSVILPLAISFYTFQQIAFLVDAYRADSIKVRFLDYALFVSFFPQLIAGPIVHHKEMISQFSRNKINKYDFQNISIGTSIFLIGLFKKIMIADNMAPFVNGVYGAAESGQVVPFFEAWGSTIAYSIQIYYDFSGYSDMAIGLAFILGYKIPLNFYSPYKAINIISFWRRWHITLSRFLRDYLYIPLGGNINGEGRKYYNLMVTMMIGGLWHGAGYNFIIWGLLHGSYLVVNQLWLKMTIHTKIIIPVIVSRLITLTSVLFAWVYFRAESLSGANKIVRSMIGLNGIEYPSQLSSYTNISLIFSDNFIIDIAQWAYGVPFILTVLIATYIFPNTYELMKRNDPVLKNDLIPNDNSYSLPIYWKPNLTWVIVLSACAALSFMSMNRVSEFLYFQF